MLTQLQLTNFAVVSAHDLALAPGFTVVTGETGAGKSLIVDALLCLTGARADSGMVRFGSERGTCRVIRSVGCAGSPGMAERKRL